MVKKNFTIKEMNRYIEEYSMSKKMSIISEIENNSCNYGTVFTEDNNKIITLNFNKVLSFEVNKEDREYKYYDFYMENGNILTLNINNVSIGIQKEDGNIVFMKLLEVESFKEVMQNNIEIINGLKKEVQSIINERPLLEQEIEIYKRVNQYGLGSVIFIESEEGKKYVSIDSKIKVGEEVLFTSDIQKARVSHNIRFSLNAIKKVIPEFFIQDVVENNGQEGIRIIEDKKDFPLEIAEDLIQHLEIIKMVKRLKNNFIL